MTIMKKIKLIFGLLSVITLASCSDFLTKDPKGTMDEDRFFNTQDAGFKSLIKCYQMLNDFYRFERPRMDLYNISTDDAEKGGSDAGDGQAASELTFGKPLASNTDLYNLWEGMYMGIARCNTLIEKIPVADMIDAAGYPLKKEVKIL